MVVVNGRFVKVGGGMVEQCGDAPAVASDICADDLTVNVELMALDECYIVV